MIDPESAPEQANLIDESFIGIKADRVEAFGELIDKQERIGLQLILASHEYRNDAYIDGYLLGRIAGPDRPVDYYDRLSYGLGVCLAAVFYEDNLPDRELPWINTYDQSLMLTLESIVEANRLVEANNIQLRLAVANPRFVAEFTRIIEASSKPLQRPVEERGALRGVYDYVTVASASRKPLAFEGLPDLPPLPGNDSLQID